MSETAGSRNDGTVDRLLGEAGLDHDAVLHEALKDLRSLAAGAPEPSAAVAALMAPAGSKAGDQAVTRTMDQAGSPTAIHPAVQPAVTRHVEAVPAATRHLAAVPVVAASDVSSPDSQPGQTAQSGQTGATPPATPLPTDELAARRRAKRRITLTTLSVAVSLAAGGAVAVASDQGIRDSIGQVNEAVSSFVASVGGGPAPVPPESPVPLPAQPGAPATVPAAPAAPAAPAETQPLPAPPESGSSQAPQHAPGQPASVPAAPGPLPDLPIPENLTPGLPSAPAGPPNGEGQPPALPLPSPPVPLPGVQR